MSVTREDSLAIHLRQAANELKKVSSIIDKLDEGQTISKEESTLLKDAMIQAHTNIGQGFGPIKSIRKDLFALKPEETLTL